MVETEIDLRGSRILAIDDEPDNLDLLCRALEDAHYEVQVAVSGEKGLELAQYSLPDLILLDVLMPGLNGYETCLQLKAQESTRDIPIIFLTGLDAASDVVEGFRAGGIDYIRKPFHKEEVLVRVHMHLERGQLIETLTRESQELVKLNAQLEEKVTERTQELHQKVIELEGKNKIAQSLLTVHTLP
ncbi:MAG: response regulator, partial [Candidatus Latescibacteria bacterium]|nr:response regulator [Candidatus Latescibacterota bacterium]